MNKEIEEKVVKEIEEKVVKVIAEKTAKNPSGIMQETSFEELGIDSLTSMEIVMAIEEEFNIEIPEAAAVKMTTIQAVIDFVTIRYR